MVGQNYSVPAYRLSDISIPQDTSKLSRIASTFVLRERAKDARMYDESGCFFVCDAYERSCNCESTCICDGDTCGAQCGCDGD